MLDQRQKIIVAIGIALLSALAIMGVVTAQDKVRVTDVSENPTTVRSTTLLVATDDSITTVPAALIVVGDTTLGDGNDEITMNSDTATTAGSILMLTDSTGLTEWVTPSDLATTLTAVSDHGALLGLGDDDHPQYAEIANTESISAVWTWANNVIAAFGGGGEADIGWFSTPSEFRIDVEADGAKMILSTDDSGGTYRARMTIDGAAGTTFASDAGTLQMTIDEGVEVASGAVVWDTFSGAEDLGVNGVLEVNGATDLDGTLNVAGTATFQGSTSGIDHGELDGLADDDHPQYAEIANAETISAVYTHTDQIIMSGVTTDITTGTNEDLTLGPNGTGDVIVGNNSRIVMQGDGSATGGELPDNIFMQFGLDGDAFLGYLTASGAFNIVTSTPGTDFAISLEDSGGTGRSRVFINADDWIGLNDETATQLAQFDSALINLRVATTVEGTLSVNDNNITNAGDINADSLTPDATNLTVDAEAGVLTLGGAGGVAVDGTDAFGVGGQSTLDNTDVSAGFFAVHDGTEPTWDIAGADGSVGIEGVLEVDGAAEISGAVELQSTLDAQGTVTITGDIGINGDITAGALTAYTWYRNSPVSANFNLNNGARGGHTVYGPAFGASGGFIMLHYNFNVTAETTPGNIDIEVLRTNLSGGGGTVVYTETVAVSGTGWYIGDSAYIDPETYSFAADSQVVVRYIFDTFAGTVDEAHVNLFVQMD